MKKVKVFFMVFLMMMLVSSVMVVPAFAEEVKGEELNLIDEESGYKIFVPNFIEVKTVQSEDIDGEINVVVMETPEKDSNGAYPIFEVITSDPNANYLYAYPGTYTSGQIGSVEEEFQEGSLMFTLSTSSDLKETGEDEIFIFDFDVYDQEQNLVFSVFDLNFMFVNKEAVAEPKKEETTASAKPTASKVVVNGKQVAFEAYNINGSNYFKLRDLAMAVNGTEKQFQVGWDSENNAINLTSNEAYTSVGNELAVSQTPKNQSAKTTSSKIYLNGEELQLTAYTIGGNNYFKLRDIAGAINFGVTWDEKLNTVGIDTSSGYAEE